MSRSRAWIAVLMVGILCFPLSLEGKSTARHIVTKRMLPDNQSCDPAKGTCSKGDFLDKSIADCKYDRELSTCTARGKTGGVISWVVAPDKNDRCTPIEKGKRFTCGERGTHTRCVCNDYKIELNECRCQYWTDTTPGSHDPALCTAYYLAGSSHVHHYACCNNCNDTTAAINSSSGSSGAVSVPLSNWKSCNDYTYEGGSSSGYCNSCGVSTGGGLVKYYFNCGSCLVQSHCEAVCNQITGLRLPGFCWKWVNCFRGCCEATIRGSTDWKYLQLIQNQLKKGQSESDSRDHLLVDFCGDSNCSAGEDHSSCPADCCYQINSTCSRYPSVCTDDCCQWPSCCLER